MLPSAEQIVVGIGVAKDTLEVATSALERWSCANDRRASASCASACAPCRRV